VSDLTFDEAWYADYKRRNPSLYPEFAVTTVPEKPQKTASKRPEGVLNREAGTKAAPCGSPIVITFNHLPDRRLHPNHRKSNFWAQRSKAAKEARDEAVFAAGPLAGVGGKPIQCCEIEEVFTVPTMRRCDVEGMMAASKAWVDGIVSAGVIVDDDWKHVVRLSGRIKYERGVSRTEVIIRQVSK